MIMTELDLELTGFPMDEATTLVARRRQWLLLPPARPGAPMLPPISLFPSTPDIGSTPADPDKETKRPPRPPKYG
jgi:hypothetical protein